MSSCCNKSNPSLPFSNDTLTYSTISSPSILSSNMDVAIVSNVVSFAVAIIFNALWVFGNNLTVICFLGKAFISSI